MAETIIDENRALEYLATKRTELSAPGMKLSTNYYSAMDSMVEIAETTFNVGRLTLGLSQLTFGSSSQLLIPNSSLVSRIFIQLVLPPLVANQTLSGGWGYQIINNITYLMGSSNVSQITYTGTTAWSSLLSQCGTAEKASELWNQAGTPQTTVTGLNNVASILLELPFSNACGLMPKKPYDTSMIGNPITITITFNTAAAIYGGIGLAPTAFLSGSAIFQQGDFTNKDQSLSLVLRKDPNLMYTYPFIHHQSNLPAQFTGSATVGAPVTINLVGLINADLVGVYIYFVQTSRLLNIAGSSPSAYASDNISNVLISFNGMTVYSSPNQLYKVVNMGNQDGASYWNNSIITSTPGGGLAPFVITPISSYMLFVDFSRLRAGCFNDSMQNVWRLGQNTLTMSFNTETANAYQGFITYNYNGIIETSNQQTRIYFD